MGERIFIHMILYNITIVVDESIHEDWLQWMQQQHIPEVMATKKFQDWKMYRVLMEKNGGITYSVQFFAKTMGDLETYQAQFAQQLQKDVLDRYGSQFGAFRTVLEQVE